MPGQLQWTNEEMVELLKPYFQSRYEPNFAAANAVSTGLILPGLRSYWVASKVDITASLMDVAGSWATTHDLPDVGAPEFGYDGLVPYAWLDGANDYFRLADAAWMDILGTEAYVQAAYRGLTLGGWFYNDTSADVMYLMAKWDAAVAADQSYRLITLAGNTVRISIRDNGGALDEVESTATFADDTWYFIAARFDPSTELKIWLNGDSRAAASALADVRNGGAGFTIGARDDGSFKLDGRFSQGFLCAMALSDAQVMNYFMQTRSMHGV